MKHGILERLISELVDEVKDSDRKEIIEFAKWSVEQGIQARHTSKVKDDQELFLASESLFAAGLLALLQNRTDQ